MRYLMMSKTSDSTPDERLYVEMGKFIEEMTAAGVLLATGPMFAPEGGLDRFLRLPYTQPASVLVDAITRLGEAWRSTLAEDPSARGHDKPTMVA